MTSEPELFSIIESNMVFGPYSHEQCFHIENSHTYQKIKDQVKIAEIVLLYSSSKDQKKILIIEAKSSSPRPKDNSNNNSKFNDFIEEIKQKFMNTLALYISIVLKRHETWQELPVVLQELDLSTIDFQFILVINGHKDEWLPPLKDALEKSLRSIIRIWKLSYIPVLVLNEKMAQEKGLISDIVNTNY